MKLSYVCDGVTHEISESDDNIKLTPVISAGGREFFAIVENCGDRDIFIKDLVIWESSALGIGNGPYEIYRSGRHKNDMPGVFTTGVCDERMLDVLGGMTETGDKEDGGVARRIVSDSLTIIKGSAASLVIEFPGGRKQLFETEIFLDEKYDFEKVSSRIIFNVILPPGKKRESESLRLVRTGDVQQEIEDFATAKATRYGTRQGQRPAVFCTWYYYGLTVTYEDVKTNLELMKKMKLPFDVFQVDEGWEITLGEWAPNEKFPVSMKQVADEIKMAGYRPGIWTSPFIAHESAAIWKEHPEWKLRYKNGEPCLFHMNDTVYHVLDITHPDTCQYFTELYRMLTDEWGYTYHKLDFTRASVIYEDASFYDKQITLAESYYRAVCAIREGMGQKSYFLMCGGLYDPIIGLVDAQRTGSDVLSMWSSNINKDGKTAPYTIRQSVMRYYMNRWWDNDPDALMIRRNQVMERNLRLTYGLLNDEEVKTCVLNQFIGGGIMCATEPLDKIDMDRVWEYRRILPIFESTVTPVDIMNPERFPGAVDVYMPSTDSHYTCCINWDDDAGYSPDICVKKLVPDYADDNDRYLVCDYYNGTYYTDVKANDTITAEPIAPHGANLFKISRMSSLPAVVRSTGHYSMGAEFEILRMEGNNLHYKVYNPFECVMDYDILLADGSVVRISADSGVNEDII